MNSVWRRIVVKGSRPHSQPSLLQLVGQSTSRTGSLLGGCTAILALVLTGCGPEARDSGPDLGDLPAFDAQVVSELPQATRERIEGAYERVAQFPADPDGNAQVGMLLHAHRLHTLAGEFYLRAHKLDPASFRWAYYLGVVELERGRTAEATSRFEAALVLDPEYEPARLAAANGSLVLGHLDRSEMHFRHILERSPASAPARFGLGQVHAERGNFPKAIEEFEQACELAPDFSKARYALAMGLRELGQTEEARQHLDLHSQSRAAAPVPDDPILQAVTRMEATSYAYAQAGVEHVNSGAYELGAKLLQRALDLNPEDEGVAVSLLIAYGHLGDLARTKGHFDRAIIVFPNSEDLRFNYATILAQRGYSVEASEAFKRVLEINPRHAQSHTSLGYLREDEGDFGAASAHYRKALEGEPGNPGARFRLGRMALARGKARPALDHFRAALADPQDQQDQLLYGIATAFAMLGEYAKAAEFAKQAHERARALGHLALADSIQADLLSYEAQRASW